MPSSGASTSVLQAADVEPLGRRQRRRARRRARACTSGRRGTSTPRRAAPARPGPSSRRTARAARRAATSGVCAAEILDDAVVGQDLHLRRRETPPRGTCPTRPRLRRRRAAAAARGRRWPPGGGRRRCRAPGPRRTPRRARARRASADAPDRVLHAVGRGEVEERRVAVTRAHRRRRRRPATRDRSGTPARSAPAAR